MAGMAQEDSARALVERQARALSIARIVATEPTVKADSILLTMPFDILASAASLILRDG
jgi:hypothetical protein